MVRADRAFGEVELAQQYRAGIGQAMNHCRVVGRVEAGTDRHACSRRHLLRPEDVLQRYRHAMQWSAPATAGYLGVRGLRLGQRDVRRNMDITPQ